ncbi:MFS transporter [Paenibacillus hexagrammi]|uniref:Major facilitator superfamily (MFS) profile domain-containing protein n=1 Tax=Paenibacillus hexagrammi TaxID=2908839 RepID=A0ABY3SJY0_9BACL|nr:hypothetical protein [Paenibacillus sp. YPD9-1]UJF33445.1 hypothetical protein L0M14_28745 [Paenibacillus sp. YPD9-1]
MMAGFIFSFSTLIINNMLRLEVEPSIQGRVFGTLGSLSSIAPPIGLACFSTASDWFSPSISLLICGIGMTALGIFALAGLKTIRAYV